LEEELKILRQKKKENTKKKVGVVHPRVLNWGNNHDDDVGRLRVREFYQTHSQKI